MGIEDLLKKIDDYSIADKAMIIRAYEFASVVHKNVLRKSGEPYITHPLWVACKLADMGGDADTICAGLLHDCIEDGCNITKESIEQSFNKTIANLVDGVTKMKKIQFNNDKELTDLMNTRHLVESVLSDIRIIVIKLVDRLHNMLTLDYQTIPKQIEKSIETMNFFVPFAESIGAYNIKCLLENLSYKYLVPNSYQQMETLMKKNMPLYRKDLDELICSVCQLLNSLGIKYNINVKTKNLYGLYNRLRKYGLENINMVHDFFSIEIIVDDTDRCYQVLDQIESFYPPVTEKRKDYIKTPKSNKYSALHTTIRMKDNLLIQFQVSTYDMHKVNEDGLIAYWHLKANNAEMSPAVRMQNDVRQFPFFKIIKELVDFDVDNNEFIHEVQTIMLEDKVYPVTPRGKVIDLPIGATPVDFAYAIHTNIGNALIAATINDIVVPLDTPLKTKDVVNIMFDEELIGPRRDYEDMAVTPHAKRRIRELRRSHYMSNDKTK